MFAAASTTGVLNAVLSRMEAPNIRVRVSYASSGALARQIAAGAPAALYLSANRKWIEWLEKKGKLTPTGKVRLFGNRLALAAPAKSIANLKIQPGFPLRQTLGDGRLAIADPAHAPAGIYARDALTKLGVWRDVADRTARAPNVLAALALIERGEAPLGIVYRTDAFRNPKVRILDEFPAGSHDGISYLLALTVPESDGAMAPFAVLQSKAARRLYADYGFTAKDGAP